jgi:hypothetical protein
MRWKSVTRHSVNSDIVWSKNSYRPLQKTILVYNQQLIHFPGAFIFKLDQEIILMFWNTKYIYSTDYIFT